MLAKAKTLSARLLHGGEAGEARDASGRRIAGNIVFQLLVRVLSMAGSVVTISLLARALGVAAFGVWTAALAFTGLFATLTELGLTNAAVLRMSDDHEREAEWLGALVGLRGLFGIVAGGLCVGVAALVLSHQRHLFQVTAIMSTSLLLAGAGSLTTVFQSRLRPGIPVAVGFVQLGLWLGAVIALGVLDAGVVTFAVAYIAVTLVVMVVQLSLTRRYAHAALRAGRALWRPLLRVALPLGIASVLIIIYYRIDSVLLVQLSSAREAGVYGAAYRFLDPLTTIPATILTAFFPVLSAARRDDPARVRRLVQACADYLGVLALPALATTLVLSDRIIGLLYGAGYGRAAGVLPILMAAFVSICFGSLAGYLAPLVNLQWRLAAYSAVGAVANVALNLVLIPPYGAFGSAWATLVTEVLTMSLLLTATLGALELRLGAGRLARTVVGAAVMAGVMVLLRPAGLAPALVAGGAVYAVALLGLRVVRIDELRALLAERNA